MAGVFFLKVLSVVQSWSPPRSVSRRAWFSQTLAIVTTTTASSPSIAQDELPSFLRDFTTLAPLGKKTTSQKTTGLSLDELAQRLTRDLTVGATGKGSYFLTGDLSKDIFRDDCVFDDPTNRVSSLSQYQTALKILFDPSDSVVELVAPLTVDNTERTITGRVRSRGYLKLPWHPYVKAYEADITYRVDDAGLIASQEQTWTKSASEALQETFTPSLIEPPPRSTRLPSPDEPTQVTQLFDKVNGRRPKEYTREERFEIAQLIDEIAQLGETTNDTTYDRDLLPGTWIEAYVQGGLTEENSGGFDFNENFQIFSEDNSVVTVDQIFGSWLDMRVIGSLQEVQDPAEFTMTSSLPKRFQSDLQERIVCIGGNQNCLVMPMQGEGLFDSVYLGERLRIGNSGGVVVVQIRLDGQHSNV